MKSRDTDAGWAWVLLCACASCTMTTSGLAILAGMYQKEFLEHFEGGVVLTSWITSLFASLMQLGGPLAGLVSSVVSCRASVMSGSVLLTVALVLAAFCQDVHMLLLTFGIGGGLGLGLIYSAAVVAVNLSFVRYRPLATGVVFAAGGVGIMGMPVLCRHLLDVFSWQESLLILACVTAQLLVAGAMLFPSDARTAGSRCRKTLLFCPRRRTHEKRGLQSVHVLVEDDTDTSRQDQTIISSSNPSDRITGAALNTKTVLVDDEGQRENDTEDRQSSLPARPQGLDDHNESDTTVSGKTASNCGARFAEDTEGSEAIAIERRHCLDNISNVVTRHCNNLGQRDTGSTTGNCEISLETKTERETPRRHDCNCSSTFDGPTPGNAQEHALGKRAYQHESGHCCHQHESGHCCYQHESGHCCYQHESGHCCQRRGQTGEAGEEETATLLEHQSGSRTNTDPTKAKVTMSTLSSYAHALTNPSLLLICLELFLVNAAIGILLVHFVMFCLEKGSDFDTVSLSFSVCGLTLTFGRVLAGVMGQDRTIDPLAVYVGLTLADALVFSLTPIIAVNAPAQIAVMALEGIYGAAGYSLLTEITIHCTGVDTLSVAFGLEMISAGLGFLVAPPIAGWLVDVTGSYGNAIFLAGFLHFLAAFVAMAVAITRPKWVPRTEFTDVDKVICTEEQTPSA